MTGGSETLVLGVGNILWADEGFGARALELLLSRVTVPDAVMAMDGGTQGLALLPHLQAHQRVLMFDAVDFGGEPASLAVVRDDAIPSFVAARAVSLHQTGMNEVLALAKLTGWTPQAMTLIGVQPVVLDDYGGSLSDAVRARLDEAVTLAIDELTAWGIVLTPRTGDAASGGIMAPALAISAYEQGRPSASEACRTGDARMVHGGR